METKANFHFSNTVLAVYITRSPVKCENHVLVWRQRLSTSPSELTSSVWEDRGHTCLTRSAHAAHRATVTPAGELTLLLSENSIGDPYIRKWPTTSNTLPYENRWHSYVHLHIFHWNSRQGKLVIKRIVYECKISWTGDRTEVGSRWGWSLRLFGQTVK